MLALRLVAAVVGIEPFEQGPAGHRDDRLGPFKFAKKQLEPGHRVVHVKNKDYVPHKEPPGWASGGKIAKFDRGVASKEPIDKGGWSIFGNGWVGADGLDPIINPSLRANGDGAFFAWPKDKIEALRAQ